MSSSIQLHTFVFVSLHWISLLYYCGDISYQANCLCVVNHSLQIYLSYSKNWWVFHPSYLEGFPKVYLVSYGWLFYVDDVFMRFIYGWYMWWIYMSMIYMTNLCRLFMWLIYLWDLHVVDIFMRFTCGWYIHMLPIYEINMC